MELFPPFPLLRNRHAQTAVGTALRFGWPEPPSETVPVALSDGDTLALEVSRPTGWTPALPTVVLVHGLTGSHRSPYMVRAAARLFAADVNVVRLNLRGCGTGYGLARRPYHAGCSEDVRQALDVLACRFRPPFVLVGYSLGGNVALKLAADLGADGRDLLAEVLAICPAADLKACVARAPALYEQYFVFLLRRELKRRMTAFPDLDPVHLPRWLSLRAWDNLYTAPQCGFQGADDYYAQASAVARISRIRVSCRVLLAEDDPIIDPTMFDALPLPRRFRLHKVAHGGHLGFVASPRSGGLCWLEAQLLRWIL